MAESQLNTSLKITKESIPSNEEVIESLMSDLKDCVIKEEEEISRNELNPLSETDSSQVCGVDNTKVIREEVMTNTSSVLGESEISMDEEEEDTDNSIPTLEDDLIDELAMKDRELTYTEEDRQRLHKEAEVFKLNGNELFKSGQFRESALAYTQALRTCPLAFDKERAIFYANRAAAKSKLELNKSAIEDCTSALELDDKYLKVLLRRAQLYETTDQLDEALADYNRVLEIDPLHGDALHSSKRLPPLIQERNEKLKTEMLGKLKDLGNMFLKPFGLSTENFQLAQDPNSGGYSVNFKS